MYMAEMAGGPKIWGAQHYKLSISLSICISVVEALEARPPPHHHHPVPPALMYIKENAKAKAKK